MEAYKLMEGDWAAPAGGGLPEKMKVTQDGSVTKWVPVPLTADVLAANGFKVSIRGTWGNTTVAGYLETGGCDISVRLVGNRERQTRIINNKTGFKAKWVELLIRYVHQLQQACRLCGLHEFADNLSVG